MVEQVSAALAAVPEGFGGLSNEALNTELIDNGDIVLIDVRTRGEVSEKGRIDAPFNEQMNIPLEEFVALKDDWPADKDTPIVIYCGSGHRSTMAMTIMWAYGYTDVRSLQGGFGGWAGAGFPVSQPVTLDVVFDDFLANMQAYNTIGLEDANLALIEDPPPFLLDVREIAEVEENGHIESAVLIPLRELAQNLEYLPSFDTPIITYCAGGWRATIAMTALQAMGWTDVTVLKGGSFSGWVEAGYPTVDGLPPDALELNVAEPNEAIVAEIDAMLTGVPEGFGVITADNLNLALVENPDLILIDVRRAEEVAENGIIAADNVVTIPIEEFIMQKEMWPEDLDAPIVVYCGSGHRSTIGMAILWSYGYSDVRSLSGGFSGWAEAGYPVAEAATP
jgi:rhodanese-related sulfurtransferase